MNTGLLFEGSEKKLEIVVSPTREPLRNKPEAFWQKICRKAGARILSRSTSAFCHSYILSESSLFVWDHRLLMLTCGRTSLIEAMLSLTSYIKEIELIFYQRKNEFFPNSQKSSFRQDLKRIKKKIPGKAYCFGTPDEHHFYVFHSESSYFPQQPDRTIEVLMYDLDNHIKEFFFTEKSAKKIRQKLGLDSFFPSAQIEDYIFSPAGYSLNALIGKSGYYTIHVTPQDPGFYVSFETNILKESIHSITKKITSLFKPLTFDVIVFSSDPISENPYLLFNEFKRSSFFTKRMNCGYIADFASFFTDFKKPRPAFELK